MKANSDKILRQLKTARGQIDGIIKMIEEDRYCIDISNQLLATKAIISKVDNMIISEHIDSCVLHAMEKGTKKEKEEKLKEIKDILKRL